MADNWQPSKEETALIYSFALQNILEYGGAQMGSIMGKLSQNFDMKQYGKLLPRYVIAQVNKANALLQKEGVEAVREELIEIDSSKMERLEKEKVKIERVFPDLPNVEQGNFKVRFAPNPNAPLTVGHMRGVLINKYYADKYNGEFVLRFDDTSTDVKPPIIKAYIQILKDIKWLTGKAPDDVLIASDRMDIYYDYADQLLSLNGAYMCNCKNFKELKDASIPCPHRDLSVEENLELFNKMKQGDFEAGEWVLRARTDLDAPNPAHRDFVLFRVQRNAHPRTGDSYKAWPMLDFQSAIDDHLSGVTHIIRGIDLQDSTAKQKILYSVFDWDYPETTYWGRVKILDQNDNEVKFSSSQYAKDIADGKFTGWDDERLYTVQAFKKRDYTPDALLEWWLEYGLTRKPITVSMKTLDTLQRRKGKMEAESFDYTQRGICDKVAIRETKKLLSQGINNFTIIEGYVWTEAAEKYEWTYPDAHTWIELKDGTMIDPSEKQYDDEGGIVERIDTSAYDIDGEFYKNAKYYSPNEYLEMWKESIKNTEYFEAKRKEVPLRKLCDTCHKQRLSPSASGKGQTTCATCIRRRPRLTEEELKEKKRKAREYDRLYKRKMRAKKREMGAEEGDEINITKTDDDFLQGKLKAALDTWDDDFWAMKLENWLGTYSSYNEDDEAREWMWANAVYYTPNHPIAPRARWKPEMYQRQMKSTYGENAEEVIKQQQGEIIAPVIAIREYDGFDYLVSGNHRSASQWNAGKKTIPTIILDMSAFYEEGGEDFLTRADDDWNAEEGGIEYKYALVAKYPDIELQDFNIPEGLQVIGKNHITIVSGKALKPVKKIVNGNKENLDELPMPPKPIFGDTGIAIREVEGEKRETYFTVIENQEEFQDYANLVCSALGIKNPEPNRFFHLSIANNQGGDSFKSVGNIEAKDLKKK